MATASEEGARVGRLETRVVLSVVSHRSTCSRCGGLMVSDSCMDLLNSTGELECAAQRCVQCGEVIDAVIQRNRQFRQESMAVRYSERTVSNNRAVEGL
ncbi:MAG TPA: hypothetical protein VF443_14730 [Nitrospira sp.]